MLFQLNLPQILLEVLVGVVSVRQLVVVLERFHKLSVE